MRSWIALLSCLAVGFAEAGMTKFWVTSTQEDFLEAEVENLTVNSDGEVLIAPNLEMVSDSKEKFVWCATAGGGGDVYFGTGDGGKIFKVTRQGEMELFCDLEEPEVLSLLFRDPYLYAGAAPTGIIYRVDAKGRTGEFCSTGQKYVWDMQPASKSEIYAATGENGRILRISAEGDAQLIYDSDEPHITRIRLHEGRLYAGTSGSGKVYEIPYRTNGSPKVIYQVEEEEIMALEADETGGLWVGANPTDGSPPSVYRVDREGTAEKIWICPDSVIYSFASWEENLLVGTGNEGRLYSLDSDGNVTLLTKCDDSALLCLVPGDGVWLGSGNMGRIYKLEAALSQEGTITSEIFDTEGLSTWGEMSWDGETGPSTSLHLSTRTGNSLDVDDTWSEWSKARDHRGKIESPDGRFIQWRAVLRGSSHSSPKLVEVSVPYVQKNLSPRVDRILLEEDHERRMKMISWTAHDPNEDSLLFDLYFRGEGERTWKLLKEDLAEASYALESVLLPDGLYVLKVLAKDSPENPLNSFLTGEKVSPPMRIDNIPPKVTIENAKSAQGELSVSVKVADEISPVSSCEYSVDAGEWKLLAPDDGIFDSTEEKFSFLAKGLKEGEHLLVVRGKDGQGNQSMARRIIETR